MAYERVIPIVDITARLVSSALSYPVNIESALGGMSQSCRRMTRIKRLFGL